MPPKCSGKGKGKAPARKRIRQEPYPSSRKVNSNCCLRSILPSLHLNSAIRKSLSRCGATRTAMTTILYSGWMFADLYSGAQSALGRSPSCHLPTPTAASLLPFDPRPAAGRYFEIRRWHVNGITAAGRVKESGSYFLPVAGRFLKAL